jgi:predicted P-loop ATPase
MAPLIDNDNISAAVETLEAPRKPRTPALFPENIPAELRETEHWLLWKYALSKTGDKWTKEPWKRSGGRASSTNPATWCSFDEAREALEHGGFDGVGYVVTEADTLTGIDLDHAFSPCGEPKPKILQLIAKFSSYTERTPSGEGFRIWVRGKKPSGKCKKNNFDEEGTDIEVYEHGRYFTVTGDRLAGSLQGIENRQDLLDELCSELWPVEEVPTRKSTRESHTSALSLSDDEILKRARAATNGQKFISLYDHGDTSGHHGDTSRADLALCGMLAFWCQGEAARIDRLFRGSALMRLKWDEKHGARTYGEMTIGEALKNPPSSSPRFSKGALGAPTVDESSGYRVTARGIPLMNVDNAITAIEKDPELRGHVWYDEFLDKILTTWKGPLREWSDREDIALQPYLQRHKGLHSIGEKASRNALLDVAFRDSRNGCKEWLEGHKWDSNPRLEDVMSRGFGATDSAYSRAVGRCWFVSMVARVLSVGVSKVDTVPVLEGSQGAGKSSALSIIGGDWYTECHESVMTKDFYGVLQGNMLVEIAEMHSFTRAEVERIKGVISCQKDRYRKAYGKNTTDHIRRAVLVCTTNREDWHKDETGGRRFWPILCEKIDLEWIRANRDQLFAEAVHKYKAGEPWWDVPLEDQAAEVEARRDVDSWEDVLRGLNPAKRYTTTEILEITLGIPVSGHDGMSQKRVSRAMKALGWKSKVEKEPSGGAGGDRRSIRKWRTDEKAPVSTVSTVKKQPILRSVDTISDCF